MGIIRLEDKYKSKYKVQFTPERHYISSSSGITGSVHVFPNRSHTQKDNIDERLNLAPMVEEGTEFSGTPIRAYDSNSLEARREEIYRGEFNKFIGGPFTDALIYEYDIAVGNQPGAFVEGVYTGEFINDEIANDPAWDFYNSGGWVYSNNSFQPTATRTSDGAVFQYRSDDKWRNLTTQVIFNKLPENDRDRSGQNFEIALGLLLDGANPFTEDHAWRKYAVNSGNSSYTNQPGAGYQFTGFKIFEDELGIPYQGAPLSDKSEVNAWPPEIAKWDANIITNYAVSGYSDLSMHPRNATKKEVILRKASHDLFSSGSLFQRTLANRIDDLETHDAGWWVHNNHSLCLSSYTDESGSPRHPCLGYYNAGDSRYTIDWQNDEATFEFWIKPCREQTDVGTILSLRDNYAVCLIPDSSSLHNGVYKSFKIGVYSQSQVASGTPPSLSDTTVAAAGGGIYVTSGVLSLDRWHHVSIRYGSLFNNGLLNVYVDSMSVTGGNVDGLYNNTTRTDGFFDVSVASSGGDTLLVGGWPSVADDEHLWGGYASNQGISILQGNGQPVYAHTQTNGEAVVPQMTLKSELKELRIWTEARTEQQLLASKLISLVDTTNTKFYLPLFFDPASDTPVWKRLGFIPSSENPQNKTEYYEGGEINSLSSTELDYNPVQFCTNSGYIVGMPFVNVHSHLKDYKNNAYPVVLGHNQYNDSSLTYSYPTIEDQSPGDDGLNYFIQHWKDLGWLRAINSMILPSDCEQFDCVYDLVGTTGHNFLDKEYLQLNGPGVGSTDNEYEIKHFYDDEIFAIQETIVAIDPSKTTFGGKTENYGTNALVSEGKLEDNDFLSPLSTVIAIPQIYYGNRVRPESVELKFTLNEDGKEITIVDFEGTLYRKDLGIEHIKSKVGHVDYGNGVLCIFSPLLTSLGVDNFDLKFQGEKNMHVMQLDIPCAAGVANKSTHPTFKKLKASANANETDSNLTFISSIYLHDENLNVIGKVNLAQPVQKREEDSFIFRVKVDF